MNLFGRRRAMAIAGLAVLACSVLAGCSAINDAQKVVHNVEGNRGAVDAFTGKLQSSEAHPFQATYQTTGTSPATILYAVQPPKELAFTDTSTNGGVTTKIIVNGSGEYACTPPSSGSSATWSCEKLDPATAATRNEILDFYTPAHWVNFLKGLGLVAGLAGDQVSSSSTTVNGFSMSCLDLVASGVQGTSRICTTQQGILGYVDVASQSTKFEITKFSPSPSASLFQLPAGATVTKVTTPTTPTTPATPATPTTPTAPASGT